MKTRFRHGIVLLLMVLSIPLAVAEDAMGPKVGQQAPPFELKDLDGRPVSLQQLTNNGHVMLIFWSTRCHFCHAMIPDFKEIHHKYKPRGLTVAAINVGFEVQQDVEAYALEFELDYMVLNDDDKKEYLAEAYQLVGTPTIEVISPKGVVLYRGHFLPKDLDALLRPDA
jgi:peroxiredoxin